MLAMVAAQAAWAGKPPRDGAGEPSGAAEADRSDSGADESKPTNGRVVSAVRLHGSIVVDGVLSEPAWQQAAAHDSFWQREPFEGKPPQLETDFRVLYGARALYIGVRARDPEPELIRGLLTRRDNQSSSDWIMVGIDSYHDRRTAFVFGVNPVGVQLDFLVYDDVSSDYSWDAVWESAARVDEQGWVAEFRIPYSQLRFSRAPEQKWGLQVLRIVARTNEQTVWSPWPKASSQTVSVFGTVDGIESIKPSRRIELLPYTTGGAILAEDDPEDPFSDSFGGTGGLGLDVKYGLGSNLTLSGALNPDFGQVEADPSEVNLSAYETFFAEKRPFFLEGSDIFGFGLGYGDGSDSVEKLFYSRRIGAPPHGVPDEVYDPCWYVDPEDPSGRRLFIGYYAPDYLSAPEATTIYSAAKLSGKTRGGWSIGMLDAVTAEEEVGEYYLDMARDLCGMEPGERTRIVEPFTNYGVLRVRRDLHQGRTVVGGAFTAVNRKLEGTGIDWLRDQAYTGGLDVFHRFSDEDWGLDMRLAGSYVHGPERAIDLTQRSSSRYYNRVDADYLDYDPTRTSLSGAALLFMIGKIQGSPWQAAVGGDFRTPGFEINDIGFQRNADKWVGWAWGQYRDEKPGELLLRYQVDASVWGALGRAPTHVMNGGDLNLTATLRSYWGGSAHVGLNREGWDTRALRGGPALRVEDGGYGFLSMWSDPRKRVRVNLNGSVSSSPRAESWAWGISPSVTVQARSNMDLSVGPSFSSAVSDSQYVDEAEECIADDWHDCYVIDPPEVPHYVLARLRQRIASLTLRLNYTFSPTLSLQLYAQPFVFAARFSDYKEVERPDAASYEDRFHDFTQGETRVDEYDQYWVDRNRDGEPDFVFEIPDVNFRQLRSNLVVRWEYRPGSTLFLIWSHERTNDVADGRFRLMHDLGELADEVGEHRIMLKLNYWVGL